MAQTRMVGSSGGREQQSDFGCILEDVAPQIPFKW